MQFGMGADVGIGTHPYMQPEYAILGCAALSQSDPHQARLAYTHTTNYPPPWNGLGELKGEKHEDYKIRKR